VYHRSNQRTLVVTGNVAKFDQFSVTCYQWRSVGERGADGVAPSDNCQKGGTLRSPKMVYHSLCKRTVRKGTKIIPAYFFNLSQLRIELYLYTVCIKYDSILAV